MNQQRSRRFRSSKEAEQLAGKILARDGVLPEEAAFDSNCITPGTDFMLKLGLAMRKWIEYKQKTDPVWKNGCDVVVSGPDVPGEGEHKVSFLLDNLYEFSVNTSTIGYIIKHWTCIHNIYNLNSTYSSITRSH